MSGPLLDHRPVVVGVDGSRAALNAVRWAAIEALARDACLRLVHAVATPVAEDADALLARAKTAAAGERRPVRMQTASIVGAPDEVLLRESRRAAMVCIGSRRVEDTDGSPIGPTARALAEGAGCPVAIIRTGHDGVPQTDGVISVVLSDDDDSDATVHLAMHEGRLRHATVRQIDRRSGSWVRRYPDVHVELVAAGTGWLLSRNGLSSNGVGLAVVGVRDARELAGLSKRNCHPILGYPDCSLLLVRS